MTHPAMILILIVMGAGAPACFGDWNMLVHVGETTTSYVVSEIDSITFQSTTLSIPMVLVPAGIFTMGDGAARNGVDERQVTLTRDFKLGQYEVTNGQYCDALQWAYDQGYITATSSTVLDNLDGSSVELIDLDAVPCEISFSGGIFTTFSESEPVVCVYWYGAAAYCDWLSLQAELSRAYDHSDWSCNGGDPYGALGYRLPTDAEWEYAAQYNDERIYPWGDVSPDCSRANYNYCVGGPSPVGSYPAAPSALLLHDMAGNVWDWCNDWYSDNLGTTAEIDPAGPGTGAYRISRGGFWGTTSIEESWMRCSSRGGEGTWTANGNIGFRIAQTQ